MDRNVVLLTVDSLRADHCGFLDSERSLTPTLDTRAEDAVVFENALAPGPRTPSSMPAILTGEALEPADLEYDQWAERRRHISRHMYRHCTLAQRLQNEGYTTVGLTVNPWTQNTGFDVGFDRFVDLNDESEALNGKIGPPVVRVADAVLKRTPLGERFNWSNRRDWFIRWTDFFDLIPELLEDVEEPYFLWLFALDTHQPYLTPRPIREEISTIEMYRSNYEESTTNTDDLQDATRRNLETAYRDAVRSVDRLVDRLCTTVVDPDDAVFVFHSDHGEAFDEHGTFGHEPELYRENLHVPFLIYDAGTAGRVDEPISLRRLPDVLASAAAGDRPFRPEAHTSGSLLASTEMGAKYAMYDGRWKYITDGDADTVELYDTAADPGERDDLSNRRAEVVVEMDGLLRQRRSHQREKLSVSAAAEDVTGEL